MSSDADTGATPGKGKELGVVDEGNKLYTVHPRRQTGTLPNWPYGRPDGAAAAGGRPRKKPLQKEIVPVPGSDQWLDEWYKSAPKIPESPEDASSIPEVKQEACDRTHNAACAVC